MICKYMNCSFYYLMLSPLSFCRVASIAYSGVGDRRHGRFSLSSFVFSIAHLSRISVSHLSFFFSECHLPALPGALRAFAGGSQERQHLHNVCEYLHLDILVFLYYYYYYHSNLLLLLLLLIIIIIIISPISPCIFLKFALCRQPEAEKCAVELPGAWYFKTHRVVWPLTRETCDGVLEASFSPVPSQVHILLYYICTQMIGARQ